MGVDVVTYRSRVGRFLPQRGAGLICTIMDFTELVKIFGSVAFVRVLLVMAGIEKNPGPGARFNFRYQFLLIDIGTKVLKEIFDNKVNKDFGQYLNANNVARNKLEFLVSGKKGSKHVGKPAISAEQAKLLPPINRNPSSSEFDITLLTCLLRNICGLQPADHPVWTNPVSTDLSIEADIFRLRKCRNELTHTYSLRLSETDFKEKWRELEEILKRLNQTARIGNLESLVHDAEQMQVDEDLKKKHDELMEAWREMDIKFDELQDDMTKLKRSHSEISTRLETVEKGLAEEPGPTKRLKIAEEKHHHVPGYIDIQSRLIEFYRHRCRTIPVSALFKNKDEDLVKIYKYPTMYSVESTNRQKDVEKQVKCYEDVFNKRGMSCEEVYITGDTGVGKTSFCSRMCYLWCLAKIGGEMKDKYKDLRLDIDHMSKYEFVFYINLRDSYHTHVMDIIIEQLLQNDKARYKENLDNILHKHLCLIIMDGLDEWFPKVDGKQKYELPERIYSNTCVYLTTSRPYRILNLSHKSDIDHQIQMTGIHGKSSRSYVSDVIDYLNQENPGDRKPSDFESFVRKSCFEDQMCIPMTAAHLVILWFEHVLVEMPKALVYANILEMFFRRAKKKEVEFPSPAPSTFHLPVSFSHLKYSNQYASLLYKVCHLSFKLLFKHDEHTSRFIFTPDQLENEPYCFGDTEIYFLCKIGILSKNEVFGCYSEEKLRISFLHKSYLEFFSALYISKVSKIDFSEDAIKRWRCLNDFLQFRNVFVLLAGFSSDSVVYLDEIQSSLSDYLTLCRRRAIFHYDSNFYHKQMESLQTVVIDCFKEIKRSGETNCVLKLADCIIDDANVDIMKQILSSNACVKSIYSVTGKYHSEFDEINILQCLNIGQVLTADYHRFTRCMLRNKQTLHTICICGGSQIPELPLRSLHNLTSLSLSCVAMQHTDLHNLVIFLTDNVLMENIKLYEVYCDDHDPTYINCHLTLNLVNHNKLSSLCLFKVNIICKEVNNSSIQSITLNPMNENIESTYVEVFKCSMNSQLEHFYIDGRHFSKHSTLKHFTSMLETLPRIKSLKLESMDLLGDFLLKLHSGVTEVKIKPVCVTMSLNCFNTFIDSFVNNKSMIKVMLDYCTIVTGDEKTHEMSPKESVDRMSRVLESKALKITYKSDYSLYFETTGCLKT